MNLPAWTGAGWVKLALAGILLAGVGYTGWMINGWLLGKQLSDLRAADSLAAASLAGDLLAANTKVADLEAAQRTLNRTITDELQPKLDAAASDGLRLARLLQRATEANARLSAVSETPSVGQPADPSRVPGGDSPLTLAAADVIATCTRDGLRLNSLIGEIERQL